MAEIYRIVDRFHLTSEVTVYLVKLSVRAKLRINDTLFDLRGNQFEVAGIEMFSGLTDFALSKEEETIGVLLSSHSGCEVKGNILARDLGNINFLFCSHPLYPYRVDEDYKEEYSAAGLEHACALFSYEDLEAGKLKLYGEEISGLTIYRGWMMTPEMYRQLYEALEQQGICLINTPEEYERYHLLPGWYEDFRNKTADSVWTVGSSIEEAMHMSKMMEGSYIVKDYVKSRKHEWYDACFIKDIQNKQNTERVISNFVTRQGETLTGGVVLRKYVPLKHVGYHGQSGMPISEEYRVFIYAGEILAVDDYWIKNSGVSITDAEYRWIESIVRDVKSAFVTVDLARKEDGTLIIMEMGDGQVSGLQQLSADIFYCRFREKRV